MKSFKSNLKDSDLTNEALSNLTDDLDAKITEKEIKKEDENSSSSSNEESSTSTETFEVFYKKGFKKLKPFLGRTNC